ncbi:unnamed protein product [Calypogeia fissa]
MRLLVEMPVSVSHGVDKLLMTVKNFGKKSASYESLTDDVQNLSKELGKMGHRTGSRSKLAACLPDDIPQGYLAVYVGNERKRFVISTKYLSHQLFKALLKKSEEEFGFDHQGGLTIACEPVLFEHLLWLLGTNSPAATTTHLQELLDFHAF